MKEDVTRAVFSEVINCSTPSRILGFMLALLVMLPRDVKNTREMCRSLFSTLIFSNRSYFLDLIVTLPHTGFV